MLTCWMPAGVPAALKLTGILPLLWSLAMPACSTREKCNEVRPGMTEKEALKILGSEVKYECAVGGAFWWLSVFEAPDGYVQLFLGSGRRVTSCCFTPKSCPAEPGVTATNFQRLKAGMTPEEILAKGQKLREGPGKRQIAIPLAPSDGGTILAPGH